MRNSRLSFWLYALCFSVVLLIFSTEGLAAGVWDEAESGINSLYESMGDLLMVVLGIGALGVLVAIIVDVIKGDKEAAHKLVWWLIGLAFGFVMLSVLIGLKDKI